MMRRAVAAGTLVLLVGCAPATSTGAFPGGSLTPSAGPAGPGPAGASPSPKAVAPIRFAWPDNSEPTVSRALTGLDESFINPGAVIDHEGTLHMFANLFTNWPGRVQVVHLTSSDGGDWAMAQDGPVLRSEDVPYAKPGIDVSTGFVRDDGTWVLVFQTVNATSPWEIGLATATGPDGPWTVGDAPVLVAGEPGSWDAGGLNWPSVVPTADGWAMYYTTFATTRRAGVIARAVSSDGLTWTKDQAPVLKPEVAWEGPAVDRPRVVAVPDGFLMVYAGTDLTDRGVATSIDGTTWTRHGTTPAITQDDFPVDGRAWDAALVERDGVLTYFLEIGAGTQALGTEVHRATATMP